MSPIETYLNNLPPERKESFLKLRTIIKENLPAGFEEAMSYGMLGYVVPHTLYPKGYHVKPELPVPYINLGNSKGHIGFYHMGIYAMDNLMTWFSSEYPKHAKTKLNIGKSCVRFKKMDDIPYSLIEALCKKVTVKEWIEVYENAISK